MRYLYKLLNKFAYFLLKISNKISNLYWFGAPITEKILGNEQIYLKLAKESSEVNNFEVSKFEEEIGFRIDKIWLNNLALKTQISIKKSKLNYAHGRVLYSAIRNYLKDNNENKINILETGTAKGFSSICMAKALQDSNRNGTIYTFDVIPHNRSFYWNSITDHQLGKVTRDQLLNEWSLLVKEYIIFHQGYSFIEIPKVKFKRIHIAFLDGAHEYSDVIFEFNHIKEYQTKGDLIIFDDYNKILFPGIVKAIDEICNNYKYNKKIIKTFDDRCYVLAEKIY